MKNTGGGNVASEKTIVSWLMLQQIFGQGDPRVDYIAAQYETAMDFWKAGEEMWKKVPDILPRHMQQLQNPNTVQAQETVSRCAQIGCQILTPEDELFPELLRNIYGVPAVLYVLGDLSCLQGSLSIAMVGRRSCSYDGMRVATEIARRLAQQQAVVVSGMAKGIDAACHWGAIEAKGKTVAVLGCGLDQVYPPENIALWHAIRSHGAVVSEYPPGTGITRSSFPVRNRLISGLSHGVVMVEGARRSGTNFTVAHALDQGREVFVVPWNVNTPAGEWAVELIRDGATPVANAEQILEEYGRFHWKRRRKTETQSADQLQSAVTQRLAVRRSQISPALPPEEEVQQDTGSAAHTSSDALSARPQETQPTEPLEGDLKTVYLLLDEEGQYCDVLSQRSGLEIGPLTAALTQLELMGLAQAVPGGRYRRA